MPTTLKSARPGSASPARAVLAVLLCTLLSGCRLGLDVALDLARDGSGRLAVTLAADAAAVERAAEAGADPLGVLAGAGEELSGQGWETRDQTAADGSREVELAVEADSAAALSAEAATLAGALAAPEARPLEPLTVTVTEDRIQVAGAAALVPETAVAEYGLTPEQAVALLDSRDALDYTVSVTLPAEVVSSDATTTAGSTLSWVVPPGQRVPITAEGVRPRFPWALAAGAAAAALALLAVAARLAARRRTRRRLASLRPWEE
jgi:hypothetical protein